MDAPLPNESVNAPLAPQTTPPVPLPVAHDDQLVVEEPKQPPKSRAGMVLVIAIVLAALGYLGFTNQDMIKNLLSPSATQSKQVKESTKPQPRTKFENSMTVAGMTVGVPTGWKVSISTQSNTVLAARLYPPSSNQETTYLDVQVGPVSDFGDNKTLAFTTENKVEKPFSHTVREGKETLLQSEREVIQWQVKKDNSQLLLTLFGSSSDIVSLRASVEAIMQNALPATMSTALIKPARAQDTASSSGDTNTPTTIAGFALADWKQITVMEGPYPERLTSSDHAYKGGYARLYTFSVLPGQRVEVLAEEGKETMAKSGSFIETEIYDANGNLLTKAGTRIALAEYDKQSSGGNYYLIVKSYPGKEGEFLLKVFDLDQVQDLYYAHYADGSELLTNNPNKDPINKNQPAVMIVHFTSPIEIVGDNKVRYFREKDNGCIACNFYAFGDITVPYVFKVNNVEVPIKITKIFLNQALIQPLNEEGFPVNSQISFEIDYGEDPAIPGSHSGYVGGFRTY